MAAAPPSGTTPPPTGAIADALPVLPLPAGVVLPGMVVTIGLESDEARAAVAAAGSSTDRDADRAPGGGQLVLVPRLDARAAGSGRAERFARVGVIGRIENHGTLPDGSAAVVVRATQRAALGVGVVGTGTALWLQVEPIDEPPATKRTPELAREYRAAARSLLEHLGGRRLAGLLRDVETPGALADTAGWWPDLDIDRKVELLETIDVDARLEKVIAWTRDALAEHELAEQIRSEVSEGMEKTQREFLLRQQLAAIRKELGETDDEADAADQYRERLAALARAAGSRPGDLPEAARSAIEREIGRLERTSAQNTEHGWIRTWLDTILALPWGERTDDDLDLANARTVLDADHTGLDEVKDRIIEELAVRRLRQARAAGAGAGEQDGSGHEPGELRPAPTILALAGPPGVGKTSLGASVARALGRRFVRVALGGVRDEAEIRGHRRTYVGAREGRIARALAEAGTMNPVFLLDEIDKVGADWRGDPSAALLEVLDPAQNHTFRDHYLEVDLDLSGVLFIATANVLDAIPGPLLDRLEVIRLDGYTDAEKVAIARDHLLPRLADRTGLRPGEVRVTDEALAAVIEGYTREAGVRGLERQLAKLLRKAAADVVARHGVAADTVATDGGRGSTPATVVDLERLRPALGRARFHRDEANRAPTPGVVNGLAVTGAGGDVLVVEATAMDAEGPEHGGLVLTGQLGEVMTESGTIALSYIRSRREALGIDPAGLRRRFHVHFPAGAVPKDGPSAGITMTTALVSLLTGRPARPSVGMTGEVTLQGKVLPIGGVKQKLLAAHRAGLTDVVIPAANEPDLDEVPATVLGGLAVHPVEHVSQVLALALEDGPDGEVIAPAGAA